MTSRHKSVETKYMEGREQLFRGLKNLDRRSFMKVSAAAMGAAVGSGLAPLNGFQPVSVAQDQPSGGEPVAFRFAYISDSHLYEREVNDRFVRGLLRAVTT